MLAEHMLRPGLPPAPPMLYTQRNRMTFVWPKLREAGANFIGKTPTVLINFCHRAVSTVGVRTPLRPQHAQLSIAPQIRCPDGSSGGVRSATVADRPWHRRLLACAPIRPAPGGVPASV